MHTEHGPLFLLCSFHPFIFFLSFGKFVSAAHRGTPPWTPVFLFPFFVFFSFPSYLFCILSILVRCRSLIFSSVAFSREILLMFIADSTYAESNASTGRPVNCPIKINMFFFVETYQKRGEYASAYGAELRSVFLPSFAVPSPRFARPLVVLF